MTTVVRVNWEPAAEETYWEMLEALPPAYMEPNGFLAGDAADHGRCEISGCFMARYEAFVEQGGRFYRSSRPLTILEFKNANKPLREERPDLQDIAKTVLGIR